ncbi:MAG: hypothetical protein ACRC9N_07440 [Aeromonas sp.]
MSIKTFIRLNKIVSADEAGLIAAGITPSDVNRLVSVAVADNWTGWQLAETIKTALVNNLLVDGIAPDLASITYYERFSNEPTTYRSESDVISAIRDRGVPDVAMFKAESLWPWIAENVDLSPEMHEVITITYPPCASRKSDTAEPPVEPDAESSLSSQVADLTERLQQAEKEIAALKAGGPKFRHMTPLLKMAADLQKTYWGDGWVGVTESEPKQFVIIDELKSRYKLSGVDAKSVERLACPFSRVNGDGLQKGKLFDGVSPSMVEGQ